MENNNQLVVKEVDFNGNVLLAVQSNEDSKIYVGVSWVCNGLQLSKSQKDTQVQNIQNDFVLKRGCLKFQAGVFDPNNETLALELEYLPLWLAKISITPKMIEENHDLAERLVEYQLKAKDILAKAFIDNNNLDDFISKYLALDEDERAIEYFKERKERRRIEEEKQLLAEQNEILTPKAESFDIFIDAKNNQKMNDVAKSLGVGRNKLFEFLRNKKVLMHDNIPYQKYCDSKHFIVKEYTIEMGGYSRNQAQTFVTAKGVDYIRKLLKEVDYKI